MKAPKNNSFNLLDQLPQYEQEGFLYPIPLLSPEEARYYRTQIETLESALGGEIKRFDFPHLFFDWAYELATHPRLLDYIETMIGSEIFIQSARIFSKPPGDPAHVTWHRDARHSNLSTKVAPTVWIALSPSTKESGCVQVLSGSHQIGMIPHAEKLTEDNLLNDGDIAQVKIDEDKIRYMELQPGEMSFHHVKTVHGSLPNQAKDRRLGFSMTIITPEMEGARFKGMFARGKKDYSVYESFQGPPTYDLQTAIKKHQEYTKRTKSRPMRLLNH